MSILKLTVFLKLALELQVSDAINRSKKWRKKVMFCCWFIHLKPQYFNFSGRQTETNQKRLFWVNIFVTFWCPAEMFYVCSLYELFDCLCMCATQTENFNKKRGKNIEMVFMLCALFSLHAAAKLKCHTNAYNLYDVYVTGMHLSPLTLVSSYMMEIYPIRDDKSSFRGIKMLRLLSSYALERFNFLRHHSTHFMEIKIENKMPCLMSWDTRCCHTYLLVVAIKTFFFSFQEIIF